MCTHIVQAPPEFYAIHKMLKLNSGYAIISKYYYNILRIVGEQTTSARCASTRCVSAQDVQHFLITERCRL